MNGFRSLCLVAAAVLIFAPFGLSSATNVYITPNGSAQGVCTTSPQNPAWFNNSANWGSGASQIGPGTTVHLCGTFTSQMNGHGSGSSGSPVTILFESGAGISVPFCPSNGCMNFNGLSWITIDGGTPCGPSTTCNASDSGTGLIEATANGTNLASHVVSQGLFCQSCNNVEIKNLIIRNMYVYVGPNDESVDHTQVQCVNVNGSNISVHDSTMHDAGWCLIDGFQHGDSNVSFYKNDVHNIDHGYVLSGPTSSVTGGPFYFYNNHVYSFSNWDDTANNNHHDGIHCFSGSSSGQTINGWYIYNNTFGGPAGTNINSFIYIEGSTGPPCATTSSPIYLFNNVFLIDHFSTAGHMGLFSGKPFSYNNTLVSTDSNSSGTCWTDSGSYGGIGASAMQNNAIGGCFILASYTPGSWASGDPDYNVYGYVNSSTDFYCGGQKNFAGWQGCAGDETHSSIQASINVSANTGIPNAGSPVIGAGTNLSSVCNGQPNPGLGALCYDYAGKPRPTTGAWDVGAYVFNAAPLPNPPSGLTASVK